MIEIQERIYDVKDLMTLLSLSRGSIYRYVATGKISCYRLGTLRFGQSHLDEFLKRVDSRKRPRRKH
jgi:excisionase family DNA binding protein